MSTLQKINLFQSVYERNPLPKNLANASVMGLPLKADEYGKCPIIPEAKSVLSVRLIPDYYKLNALKDHVVKVVPQYNWGYSIDLRGFSTIDDYLESQYKSKTRSIIRRYVRRLETCFPISYTLYHGEMEYETYEKVFQALHGMIRARFGQKKETHKELWRWEELQKATFHQILEKQASLFVIYDGEKPIEISLNYHAGPVMFSSVSSYDMDYAKFGLGHVEIYKQLEWCLSNGYTLFEMGVGGMDYKRKWSNYIYQFSHWILIPKKSLLATLVGKLEHGKIILKEYLKSKKLNELRDSMMQKFSSKNEDSVPGDTFVVEVMEKSPEGTLTVCDSTEPYPIGFNKAINDVLYQQETSRTNLTIYKTDLKSGRYYLKVNSKWYFLHNIS